MGEFEQWFMDQDFYTNMRFIHGDNLFSKDGDVYRVLPVRIAYQAWEENKSKIEQLEKEKQALHNIFVYMDECWHESYMRLRKKVEEHVDKGAHITRHRIDL